jgi:hypothetical protein
MRSEKEFGTGEMHDEEQDISLKIPFAMVSLPELENRSKYWLEIWYGGSAYIVGEPHGLLPTRDRPQVTSLSRTSLKLTRL